MECPISFLIICLVGFACMTAWFMEAQYHDYVNMKAQQYLWRKSRNTMLPLGNIVQSLAMQAQVQGDVLPQPHSRILPHLVNPAAPKRASLRHAANGCIPRQSICNPLTLDKTNICKGTSAKEGAAVVSFWLNLFGPHNSQESQFYAFFLKIERTITWCWQGQLEITNKSSVEYVCGIQNLHIQCQLSTFLAI